METVGDGAGAAGGGAGTDPLQPASSPTTSTHLIPTVYPKRRKDRGATGHTAGVTPVAAAGSGSEAAPDAARRARFERLFADVYGPLQRYLRRRTDPATAEDVLADALLVLWRRLDDVPADAELAWAYGAARRCLANAVRSTARQDRLVRRLADIPAQATADPVLTDELQALPDTDQEVLRLWAWEQLPPREIALVLGITPNAASIRLHRATKKLREQLTTRKDDAPPGHLGERQGKEAPR